MYSFTNYKTLNEKLVLYNNGAKYGQVLFLAGGPGSGKTFAAKKFMEYEKFRSIAVDDIKDYLLKLYQKKFPEKNLDVKDQELGQRLHQYVGQKRHKGRMVRSILANAEADRLPNLIFDTSFTDLGDLYEYLPLFFKAGYQPKDMHITWVLTDYKVALDRNAKRDRVVPEDILISMHGGSAFTLAKLLELGKPPHGIDGQITVIFNNPEDGKFDVKGRVEDFNYITLKKSGQKLTKDVNLINQVKSWLVGNSPVTWKTKGIIHKVVDKDKDSA